MTTSFNRDMLDRDRYPVDPWRLVETQHDPGDIGLHETLFALGNGYLGLRGNNAEGRKAHEHGTFINGLHETWKIRHAEQAYGFAEVGQTIVNAPDSKIIRIYVDDEPLALDTADLLEYERSLDFKDGMLRRSVLWLTPSGKRVRVSATRMVSFPERHLAVMTVEVTMIDADAPVSISCQMLNRQDGEDEYAGSTGPGKASKDPRKAERIADRSSCRESTGSRASAACSATASPTRACPSRSSPTTPSRPRTNTPPATTSTPTSRRTCIHSPPSAAFR